MKRRHLVAAALYVGAYALWQRWEPGGPVVSDLAFVPITAVAVAACLMAARRELRGGLWWGWTLIAIALVSYGIGDCLQAWQERGGRTLPYPGPTDVFYLAFYPLAFAGLLCFAASFLRGGRLQIGLDGTVVALAGGAALWFFTLGPTVAFAGSSALFPALVTVAYPCGDLFLVVGLSYLFASVRGRAGVRPLVFLALAIGLYVVSDAVYAWQQAHNAYVGGNFIDLGYLAATAAFGLAALNATTRVETSIERRLPFSRVVVLPQLGAAVVFGLIAYQDADGELAWTGLAVALLLAARHTRAQRLLVGVQRELELLSVTDPHTGLPNYRALAEAVDRETERSSRNGRGYSLVFVDIDHFKRVNDTAGHEAGDRVLRDVGSVAGAMLRKADTLARWGGEELVALLPETDGATAVLIAERMRHAVAAHEFDCQVPVTVSVGVASYPDDATTREALFIAADDAMYAAKSRGRNRVVRFGAPSRPVALAF